MSNIEIEIQVRVEKIKPLLDFLKKNGRFVGESHQVDEYFNAPHKDFVKPRPIEEWLRLRVSNRGNSANYKKWHYDKNGKGLYADEFETVIEDIDKMRNIFISLDFKPLVTVDKERKIWIYKDYEISIDIVKDLGDYVEIEYIGKKKVDPKQTNKQMIEFLKDTGCGKLEVNHAGYPGQLILGDEVKFETL